MSFNNFLQFFHMIQVDHKSPWSFRAKILIPDQLLTSVFEARQHCEVNLGKVTFPAI